MSTIPFVSRAQGALLGLAIGDALGTTLEFQTKDSFTPITDMIGGGPFDLEEGQWTDDTSMALCLADSLLACGEHNAKDQIERYIRWRDQGYNSCTGHCFDIGNTVANALTRYLYTSEANAGSTDERSAGNGSIMRLSPIVIFYARNKGYDLSQLLEFAEQSSLVTHGEERCLEACRILAHLISQLLMGESCKTTVITRLLADFPIDDSLSVPIKALRSAVKISAVAQTSRDEVFGRGYVVDSLQAAIWCFMQTDNFKDGALLAANLGDDADTTCAVYGQIAGAYYGIEGIPDAWLEKLHWRVKITETATLLALYTTSSIAESEPTYFKLKAPVAVAPIDADDDGCESIWLDKCPLLDLRSIQTRESLLNHTQEFLRYTFGIPNLIVSESSCLDELERIYYAKLDGVTTEEVGYGRLFCDSNGDGGISDRGLVNYSVLYQDLPETLGFDGSTSPIQDYDFTLTSFNSDWLTIKDIIDSLIVINHHYLTQQ